MGPSNGMWVVGGLLAVGVVVGVTGVGLLWQDWCGQHNRCLGRGGVVWHGWVGVGKDYWKSEKSVGNNQAVGECMR